MATGLHARKKGSSHEDGLVDPETPMSPAKGGATEDDDDDEKHKAHGRTGFLRRFFASEIGCAIEVVVCFLVFGLLFGSVILHTQRRKVRRSPQHPCCCFEIEFAQTFLTPIDGYEIVFPPPPSSNHFLLSFVW